MHDTHDHVTDNGSAVRVQVLVRVRVLVRVLFALPPQ
jgi:hypothetical protein